MNTKMNQRTDDRTFADEMRFTSTEPMNGVGEKKDVDDVASVLETENGRTVIQSEVVAKIAGMAMREVEGVYSLAP
jgi:hypothetical protein